VFQHKAVNEERNVSNVLFRDAEVHSKMLSLHLLKIVIENAGPVFKSSTIFTTGIQKYLCAAMLENSGTLVPEIFKLNVDIFLLLLTHFRNRLKSEVEVG